MLAGEMALWGETSTVIASLAQRGVAIQGYTSLSTPPLDCRVAASPLLAMTN